MRVEPVACVDHRAARHHPVARHLGNDGSRCDRLRTLVALDQRAALAGKARRNVAAVGQHEPGRDAEPCDGAAHGLEAGAQDVGAVDAGGRDRGRGHRKRRFEDRFEDAGAVVRAKPLGIVQPVRDAVRVEHDRRRDHRSGERAAAGLVGARDRPPLAFHGAQFDREIGPVGHVEKKGRTGNRATHRAAMLAPVPVLRKPFPAVRGGGAGRSVGQRGERDRPAEFLASGRWSARQLSVPHNSDSCSPWRGGGENRSVRNCDRWVLRPSRRAASSKRRPICQA